MAALIVVAYHVMYATGLPDVGGLRNYLVSGYMGVDFFFVLSGFVLFLPVAGRGVFGSKGAYAIRRAARIIPAFYLAVFATVLFHPWVTKVFAHVPLSSPRVLDNLLLHLTFLQHSVGLVLGFHEGFGVNGALWTLSIEAMFYVLLPLIALAYYRRPFLGFGVALAGSIVWKYAAMHNVIPLPHSAGVPNAQIAQAILVTQLPTYLAHFGAGMTGAWIYLRSRDRFAGAVWLVGVQLAALAGIIYGMGVFGTWDMKHLSGLLELDHFTLTTPIALSFGVLLLATAMAPEWAQFPFKNVVARFMGDISYGVYLWHLLFIGYALTTLHFAATGHVDAFLKMGGFVLAGSIVAATLSHYLVERPILRWARRYSERRKGLTDRPTARLPVLGGVPPLPAPALAAATAGPGRYPRADDSRWSSPGMTVPALIARPTRSWLWVGAHAASGSAVARVDGTRAGQISTVANGHPTNGTNSRNGHDHRWGVQGVPANGHPANGHHIVAQGRVLVASGEPPGADPGPDYEVLKVTEITGRTAGLPTYPSRRLP